MPGALHRGKGVAWREEQKNDWFSERQAPLRTHEERTTTPPPGVNSPGCRSFPGLCLISPRLADVSAANGRRYHRSCDGGRGLGTSVVIHPIYYVPYGKDYKH